VFRISCGGAGSERAHRPLVACRDQFAIAVFGATFTFAIFSLRAIDTGPGGTPVPGLTVLTALALAVASGLALLFFVNHAGHQLRVGDTMIGAVNAEVFNPIAQRLKGESPFKATMMATLTNGSARSGYIPDDASYGKYTFEVLSSRLQPGCAEASIVRGLLDLIDGARQAEAR